jgi:hypothetical protein
MNILIPPGLDITPDDIERGEIESLAVFAIDDEAGTLTLKSIDGVAVEPEDEGMETEEAMTEEAAPVPTEQETIGDFVRGEMAKRKKQ